MSLAQRVSDLTDRLATEFKLLREEVANVLRKGDTAGGVLGGTYPDPGWAANVLFQGRGLFNGAIIQDGLDVRGVNNKFSVGSVTTLHDKTAGSVNAPVLVSDYSVSADLGDYLYNSRGFHLDSTEGNRHSAGRFFGSSNLQNNNKRWEFPQVSPVDGGGGPESFFKAYAMTRIQNPAGARSIVWGEEMKQGLVAGAPATWKMEGIWMRSYDDAPLASDQAAISKITPLRTDNFSYFYAYQLGRCFSVSGAARASEFCAAQSDVWNGILKLKRWTATDDGSFVNVQTVPDISAPWFVGINNGPDEALRGVAFGSSTRMGFHGVNQDIWVVFTKLWAYVYNAAGTARITDLEFPSVGDQLHFTIGDLATNEFAGFRAIPFSDKIPMTRYTDISWPSTDSSLWWAGYTWYDSAGTTHETNMSIPGSITMKKRSRLTVSTGPLPDPAAGAGQTRGPDDVNSFRLYMTRGPVRPPNNQFFRQSVQPAALATTVTLTTMPVWSGTGLAPPDATNFPGAGPASLQSSAVNDLDGTPKFRLTADGLAKFETLNVGGLVTGMIGRGIDQLFYMQRGQALLTGGGKRTVANPAVLTWSSRFIVISMGRGPTLGTTGYFSIAVPPVNTPVVGYGGASTRNATTAGVPLNGWDTLWYELPLGGAETSVPGNFRVTNYTGDVIVPNNWIMIAMFVNEGSAGGNYIQWGDGIKTGIPGWYDATAYVTPGTMIQRHTDILTPEGSWQVQPGTEVVAYYGPSVTVPAGARTANVLFQVKGRWFTNAAGYWFLRHNSGILLTSRTHNNNDPTMDADTALNAILNVTPGDNFQCWVIFNNDPGSGSLLQMAQAYYHYHFIS